MLEQVPLDRKRPYLLRSVVDTKQPLFVEHVTSDSLASVAQGPEHLRALRAVSPTSLMALPLLRQGQLLGVLAFISSPLSPVRAGRSSSGRGAGGPSGHRNRECPSLQCFSRGSPGP